MIRRCRVCECRSDEVKFVMERHERTKVIYPGTICSLCRNEQNNKWLAKKLKEDPQYGYKKSQKWRDKNMDKYKKSKSEYEKKRRLEAWKEERPKNKKMRLTQIFKIPGRRNNNKNSWSLAYGKNSPNKGITIWEVGQTF